MDLVIEAALERNEVAWRKRLKGRIKCNVCAAFLQWAKPPINRRGRKRGLFEKSCMMMGEYAARQLIAVVTITSLSEARAMKRLCSKFMRDESGATAIEYGLIASGITLAILGTIQTMSTNVKTMLWDIVAAATAP